MFRRIISHVQNFDKVFCFSFIGVVIAIFSFWYFVYKSTVNISYEIVNKTNVLDIRENVGSLDIIYAGNSIKKSSESLSIYTIRVINDGQVPIRQTDYDSNVPLGLRVVQGEVVEPPVLINASNQYLKDHVIIDAQPPKPTPEDSSISPKGKFNQIKFSSVIIDTGHFFDIKLLVLHDAATSPTIRPLGKIAGIPYDIPIKNLQEQTTSSPFLSRAFGGDPFIQAIRLVCYFLMFLIILIVVISTIAGISNFLDKLKDRNLINKFVTLHSLEADRDYFASVLEESRSLLRDMADLLSRACYELPTQNDTSRFSTMTYDRDRLAGACAASPVSARTLDKVHNTL